MPEDIASALVPAATSRMKRAAAFAFTASLGLAGCSSTTGASDANVTDTQATDTQTVTDNGAPTDRPTPTDTQTTTDNPRTDTGQDVPEDFGNVAPPYGIPPPEDAGAPDDTGGAMADYGAPPPPFDGGP